MTKFDGSLQSGKTLYTQTKYYPPNVFALWCSRWLLLLHYRVISREKNSLNVTARQQMTSHYTKLMTVIK